MKLIQQLNCSSGKLAVKVYWNATWSEYQVKPYNVLAGQLMGFTEAFTYHTDSKDDAIGTARKMLTEF